MAGGKEWSSSVFVGRAERVVVVADHTKLGRRALTWLCNLNDIDDLVVDDRITDDSRKWLEDAGICLHVARRAGV